MTALANLSALVASWRREADDMERAGVSPSTTLAIRANADELEATLSPAELGGVEYVDPADVFLSQGVDDVPCLQVPGRVLVRFNPGSWDHAYELFSGNTPTPRADESEWRPIESAPRDGTRIAIKFQSGNEHEANWQTTYGGEWHVDSFKFLPWADQHEITHWHPLPSPPSPGAAK